MKKCIAAFVVAALVVGAMPQSGRTQDCDPPLQAEIDAAAERDAEQAAKVYDQYIDPQTLSLLEDCFAAINPALDINLGLPSMNDILGALCMIVKQKTEEYLSKLNKEYNVSALDGLVSVGGSASATGGGSGVKVHDTSGRAVSDILRRLQ